jgi:hypothetical protein
VTLEGNPLAEFHVRLRHATTAASRYAMGSAGAFSIDTVAGDYELIITSDRGYAKRTLALGAGKPATVDVTLTPWASLRARFVGPDGAPWADTTVLDAGTIEARGFFTTLSSSSTDLGLQFFVSVTPPTAAQLAAVQKDPRAASRGGSDANSVLWIVEVTPNSPAARAGLRKGDRIVGVGLTKVSAGKSAVDMMMSLSMPWRSKGRVVPWTIMRDGRELKLDVLVP